MTDGTKPTGTLVFLFTDIEGSTRTWQAHGSAMAEALQRHDELVGEAIRGHGGHVFKTVGDAFCAVFTTAERALAAAVTAQRALAAESWSVPDAIRVRMALHAGAAEERDDDYFGPTVNRVARLLSAGHGGQVLLSGSTTALISDALPKDIGLRDLGEHRLKDLDRPERVFQAIVPGLPSEFGPLNTIDARPNNLPLELNPFVGRARELERVKHALLRPEVRLLTLTGPGGIGKSRLALQVAADVIDEFPDGAFLVSLASVTDWHFVAQAIADVLVVREVAGQTLYDAIRDHLRGRHLLLVLDNFEHVLAAAGILPSLLRDCPKLKVLVTSRSVLRVSGEHESPVPILGLPPVGREGRAGAARALESDAVRLFLARVRTVKSEFDLTDENAATVVEICRRLDGLPLAIELAAARVRMLSPEAILARLSSRLKLLTGGARDLPERQQTLRGAIVWSYDLLPSEQQKLLARLSVFARGATFESAEIVCSGSADLEIPPGLVDLGAHLEEIDVFDGISALVDHSLLRQDEEGAEVRYSMLETIREFGLEQLSAQGELDALTMRHAVHYRVVAEQAANGLLGPKPAAAVAQLDAEVDNLRAALSWSLQTGTAELGLRLGRSMIGYWQIRGLLTEGRSWLERVLALGGEVDTTLRARVLNNLGNLSNDFGDYQAARTAYEESLAIWRATGDRRAIATVLNNLGQVAGTQGDYERARALHSESLAIRQELGDERSIAIPLHNLGVIAHHEGDFDAAVRFHREALAIRERLGDTSAAAYSSHALAHVLHHQGDDEAAAALFRKGIAHFRSAGDRVGLALALGGFAEVAREAGRDDDAGVHFVEALTLWQEIGARRSVRCLEEVAALATKRGRHEQAARLLGAAAAIRDEIGEPIPPIMRAGVQETADRVRSELGEPAFVASVAAGQALEPSAAIDEAITEASFDLRESEPLPATG